MADCKQRNCFMVAEALHTPPCSSSSQIMYSLTPYHVSWWYFHKISTTNRWYNTTSTALNSLSWIIRLQHITHTFFSVKLFAFVCLASLYNYWRGGHCVILYEQCTSVRHGGAQSKHRCLSLQTQNNYPCFMSSDSMPVSVESCGMHVSLSYVLLYVSVPAGYGFVDFDSPASAQKAVTALKAGGVQAQMAKVRTVWEHLVGLFLYNVVSE